MSKASFCIGRRREADADHGTDASDAGTWPTFLGFGSILVESSADTIAMIDAACAQLDERALECAVLSDFSNLPSTEHVKIAGAMSYAAMTQMTASAESVAAAADLLEDFAHATRAGATGGLIPRGPAAP